MFPVTVLIYFMRSCVSFLEYYISTVLDIVIATVLLVLVVVVIFAVVVIAVFISVLLIYLYLLDIFNTR